MYFVRVCETWSTYRGFSWRERTEMYKVRLAQRQLKPSYLLDFNHSICCTLYSFPLLLCCRTFCVSNCDLLSATQPYWYTIDYYRSKWKYVQKLLIYIDDPTWTHAHTHEHTLDFLNWRSTLGLNGIWKSGHEKNQPKLFAQLTNITPYRRGQFHQFLDSCNCTCITCDPNSFCVTEERRKHAKMYIEYISSI